MEATWNDAFASFQEALYPPVPSWSFFTQSVGADHDPL